MEQSSAPRESGASNVASGILASKLVGLLRERVVAHYFGIGGHTDVFQTAFRGPNILQNLLGEGTISAAFIPIYSSMIEEGRTRDAGRFAGAIFGLLLAVATGLSLIGVLLAEPIVTVLTPGFLDDAERVAQGLQEVDRFALTVLAVRIIFPMTGLLVLSAWALGILNSHRRFFLPYFAPVLWNVAIIAGLFITGHWILDGQGGELSIADLNGLVIAGCVGALVGGLLQFLVQLPLVVHLLREFKFSFSLKAPGVKESIRAFGPVVAGRGVYQISAYLDLFLASFLMAGALGALRYAQMLYTLPVSLFGLSVAASELPELSRMKSDASAEMNARINQSLRQMLFLVTPTVLGYLVFGYLVVGALYETGSFGVQANWLVYILLCAYTIGLTATTASRLLQNTFYALRDTKTPARIAVARVVISTAVAVPLMFLLDRVQVGSVVGLRIQADPLYLGAAGLAIGSAAGAWVELLVLGRYLRKRLGRFPFPLTRVARMLGLSVLSAIPALLLWYALPAWHVVFLAVAVVGLYGLTYLSISYVAGFQELSFWTGRLRRR